MVTFTNVVSGGSKKPRGPVTPGSDSANFRESKTGAASSTGAASCIRTLLRVERTAMDGEAKEVGEAAAMDSMG